ncbi:MAG: hypothetical protein O2866_04475 [archaeon]|jgi:predicted transcriptional regulator|nr:hypothetical protein [archaeon]MDA1168119.1 hypothetical protein [archaeon]
MAKNEPMLKDLRHADSYAIVEPHVTMPEIAKLFAKDPNQAVLVLNPKKNKFVGVMYLYDLLTLYGAPPRHVESIHKATIGQCANTRVISIQWDENISQAWAKINKYKPKAVLLHDESKEFVGYISNEDLWEALEEIGIGE